MHGPGAAWTVDRNLPALVPRCSARSLDVPTDVYKATSRARRNQFGADKVCSGALGDAAKVKLDTLRQLHR